MMTPEEVAIELARILLVNEIEYLKSKRQQTMPGTDDLCQDEISEPDPSQVPAKKTTVGNVSQATPTADTKAQDSARRSDSITHHYAGQTGGER